MAEHFGAHFVYHTRDSSHVVATSAGRDEAGQPCKAVRVASHCDAPLRRSPTISPRSVRWNEDNLAHNEATKSATMKIDEPETPWASPPRELFDDDAAAAAHAAASHAGDHADAFRLAAQLAAAEGGFVPGAWGAAQPRDEAAAADHMAVDAQARATRGERGEGRARAEQRPPRRNAHRPGPHAARLRSQGAPGEEQWEEPAASSEPAGACSSLGVACAAVARGRRLPLVELCSFTSCSLTLSFVCTAEDVELRKRLFEARRKALQGSYAGAVRAREQDQAQQLDGAEEDGEASGEDANKRMREEPLPPL